MSCTDARRYLVLLPLLLVPLVGATGCAGDTSSEDGAVDDAPAAATSVPAYDAVIRNGTKVDTEEEPTTRASASTHLLGYIPRVAPAGGVKQLLTVGRWADIRDADGTQPFTSAQIVSDSGSGATRKLTVKLTLDGGVDLDVKAVATEQDTGIVVRIVNTSAYSHWLAGTILEPEKLVMELKLVPYKDGLIVDATTRVKLAQMEDRAPKLTASIRAIFDWLKRTAR
jgi:hypothetical protein